MSSLDDYSEISGTLFFTVADAHSQVVIGGRQNGPAQIGTDYISVGCKNRQSVNRATEDLTVTSRRNLQHGIDTHDIRKIIVTNFANTSSRWLHECIS
jgi:hypothetical protein